MGQQSEKETELEAKALSDFKKASYQKIDLTKEEKNNKAQIEQTISSVKDAENIFKDKK